MNSGKCLIWPDSPADATQSLQSKDNSRRWLWIVESPRSGGSYEVFEDVFKQRIERLDDRERARLTTLLVDWRNHHGDSLAPEVTLELIDLVSCRQNH